MGSPNVSLRHRPDPVEKYWANTNYGNHLAYKRYAGWPLGKPIQAVVIHGVFYESDYVFPGEASAPVPCVLNYPEHRDAIWSTYKHVIPAAAPFLYALELYPHNPVRRGTVVMPQHTTTLLDMEFDWWTFSESLKGLPKPITVLLYYNDVQKGEDKYFREKVKTCGHVNDPEFLRKLVWHLTGAEWVVSNEVGSYTQYATVSGAKFRLIGEPPRFVLNEQGVKRGFRGTFHNSEDRHHDEQRHVAEIDALYRDHDFAEPVTGAQREAADFYLRRSAMKRPEALFADLERCASLRLTPEMRKAAKDLDWNQTVKAFTADRSL